MGSLLSRRIAGVEDIDIQANSAYRYPPKSGRPRRPSPAGPPAADPPQRPQCWVIPLPSPHHRQQQPPPHRGVPLQSPLLCQAPPPALLAQGVSLPHPVQWCRPCPRETLPCAASSIHGDSPRLAWLLLLPRPLGPPPHISHLGGRVSGRTCRSTSLFSPPPRPGTYFASHFFMGGEKFDTPHPEGYLFGENMDLNFLGNRPVQASAVPAMGMLLRWE